MKRTWSATTKTWDTPPPYLHDLKGSLPGDREMTLLVDVDPDFAVHLICEGYELGADGVLRRPKNEVK